MTIWSLAIAIVSLLVSVTTAYWNLWRKTDPKISLPSDMWLSNTVGGVPDVIFSLALWGSGSPNIPATIQSIGLYINNTTNGREIELEGQLKKQNLPIVVFGRQSELVEVIATVNDYIPQQMQRYDKWCDDLLKCVNSEKKRRG